jgi:hypothetical protein
MTPVVSHLQRTPPERCGPIRNAMAPPRPGPKASKPVTAAGSAVCGELENGVRTAYAVIDEYMRRGQDAARGISNDSNRRGDMSDYKSNYGGGYNNPPNPFAMLTEQWLMAMRMWSQAWSAFMPGMWPQQGWPTPSGMPQGYEALAPKVSVQVSSTRPVEVTVTVNPGSDLLGLAAEPLRPEGFAATAIEPPTITHDPGCVRVAVKVAANQPAGRYSSFIRKKADESIAGEMTVVVS